MGTEDVCGFDASIYHIHRGRKLSSLLHTNHLKPSAYDCCVHTLTCTGTITLTPFFYPITFVLFRSDIHIRPQSQNRPIQTLERISVMAGIQLKKQLKMYCFVDVYCSQRTFNGMQMSAGEISHNSLLLMGGAYLHL